MSRQVGQTQRHMHLYANPKTGMRVSLHLADHRSVYDHPLREFVLALNSVVNIGRASKDSKKNLMADADNALFDCAVMSRSHARLSARLEANKVSTLQTNKTPQVQHHSNTTLSQTVVYLTDTESTHGTFVNNIQIRAYEPKSLSSGDVLRFGGRVECGACELSPVKPFDRSINLRAAIHKGSTVRIFFQGIPSQQRAPYRSRFGPTYSLTYSPEESQDEKSEPRPTSIAVQDRQPSEKVAASKTEVTDTYADNEVLEVGNQPILSGVMAEDGARMLGSSAADPVIIDPLDTNAIDTRDHEEAKV